jgi:hypothetical protein
MNMHTIRQKKIGGPETMNWTPVEVPVQETAAPHLKGTTAQYLMRHAHRVSKIGTNTLIFLTFGATGLWAVVDFVKLVIEWWKDR